MMMMQEAQEYIKSMILAGILGQDFRPGRGFPVVSPRGGSGHAPWQALCLARDGIAPIRARSAPAAPR